MSEGVRRVLFLCTGNSARSLLAECMLNRWGWGRFEAYSAGSYPKPAPHPIALKLLRELDYETGGLRCKSWDEFAAEGAPQLHFVFTVCDNAAGEQCPIWPGRPITAHWGVEDPANATGTEEQQLRVFRKVYGELENRIKIFTSLPFDQLDRLSLQKRLDAIGKTSPSV